LLPSAAMPVRLPGPDLPQDVRDCVDAVVTAGGRVFAVGGAVRDRLLGLPVDDFDFATALLPGAVSAALAAGGHAVDVDDGLGRVATPAASGGEVVFTTFRRESGYGPHRRPRRVEFVAEPDDDAARRDFTINAIYQDIADGQLIDPVGGLADLDAMTLRVIGDARRRLSEDPLRILRAIRFEASRGLGPSPETWAALAECAPLVAELSGPRRFEELDQMLGGTGAVRAAERFLDLGILGHLVPVLRGKEQRVRECLLPFLEAQGREPPGAISSLGAFAVLCGDSPAVEAGLIELGAPRAFRQATLRVVSARRDLVATPHATARSRVLSGLGRREREILCAWDDVEEVGGDRVRRLLEMLGGVTQLPSGSDVLALGVPPGPGVGAVLRAVTAAVDQQGVTSPSRIRDILVHESRAWIKRHGESGR
jgi:hypothetical protein